MKQMSKLWETLQTKLKNILSPTTLKKKIPNGTQRTVRIVYIKELTKHFCKLSTRTSLFCNMCYVIHIKESPEAVIDRKLTETDLS